MRKSGQTEGVYYAYDGDIQYKITYYRDEERFRIFKQYHDEDGKYRRLTKKNIKIADYDKDLNELKRYIHEELIGKDAGGKVGAEEKRQIKKEPLAVEKASCLRARELEDLSTAWAKIGKDAREKTNAEEKRQTKNEPLVVEKAACPRARELEDLFTEWENAQKNEPDSSWKRTNGGNKNIGKAHFRRDGIIDEDVFKDEALKILFISAEANDNEYSALIQERTDTVKDYLEYHWTGKDDWKGKMRERLAEIYKVICGIERGSLPNKDAVLHFAVMDINKRGGGPDMGDRDHIKEYCSYYADYIRREIELIDPDIVAMIGTSLYDMQLHSLYLGAVKKGEDRYFFDLKGKQVPILRLYQTCYYQGKNEPLPGYEDNLIIGKQAAKCVEELKRFGLR